MATRAEVFATRFDHCLTRLRAIAKGQPALADIYDELVRLRRDMAGLPQLPAPAEAGSRAETTYSRRPQNHQGAHTGKERNGKRHCPKHDGGEGAWLPIDRFGVKNPTTGALKSWCIECTKAYQRERYVRVGAKVLTVELIAGDFLLGHKCPRCLKRFEIGQRVQGDDLHHEGCRSGSR